MKQKQILMMKQINFLILVAFVNLTFAQQNTSALISNIHEDGLHEISVPPAIRSFSKKDLSDFRIFDSKENEVPYFIRRKNKFVTTNEFLEFKIISKEMVKDSSSTIIFQNPNETIDKIIISLANYAGSKTYNLSGSNDQKQWFGLANKQRLTNIRDEIETSVQKIISLPLNSYRYLKIDFNDINSLPVNILRIGNSLTQIVSRDFTEIKATSKIVSQDIDLKKTQIHVTFENKEYLNYIRFNITEPQRYKRTVRIYTISSRLVKQQKENYEKTLTTFDLNSNSTNTFDITELFQNDIYVEIENEDNPSLTINEILFFQEPLYIIADLKMTKNYTVKTGDEKLKAPKYDIAFFKNNITTKLPKAEIRNVQKKEAIKKVVKASSFWQKPWFMWLCIAIAAIAIFYFTSNLVKDLKKE